MEFLINITIKSTLILLGSGIVLFGLKRATATLRHWVISLTMIGLLCLPILIEIIPSIQVEMPESIMTTKIREVPVTILDNNLINKEEFALESDIIEEVLPVQTVDYQGYSANVLSEEEKEIFSITLSQVVLIIWLVGFVFLLIKYTLGYYQIRKITISSLCFVLPDSLKNYVAGRTKKEVKILINKTIKTPMTWGGLSPVILLPDSANDWTIEELKTVLLHELTHIKRNDYWLHTLGLLTVCFYWYNPLVWLMKKQQLLEREKACDEAVIRGGVGQQNYAEQLVAIARQLSGRSSMMSENALPMAKISQTKARIIAILNYNGNGFRFLKLKQWNWGVFYTLLFPVLAAFSPIAKEIIGEHNPLPKLATISQEIYTVGLDNIKFYAPSIAQNQTNETVNLDDSNEDESIIIDRILTNNKPNNSPSILVNRPIELDNVKRETDINIPPKVGKKGLFGKWEKGKSEFRIYTYGEFEILDKAPYIRIISSDGIVYLEECIKGPAKNNIHQYTFAKLQYDARHKPLFRDKIDLKKDRILKKGDQVEIWSGNKGFLLFNRQKTTWLKDNIKAIKQQVEEGVVKPVTQENKEWWERIEGIPDWIDFNYISEKEVQTEIFKQQIAEKISTVDEIPFLKLPQPEYLSKSYTLGRKESIGSGISGSLGTNPVGNKYTTVIKGKSIPTLLKDFNFHLISDFKHITFELSLYNIKDGKIAHSILKKPITIEVPKGAGWVNKDLSKYGLVSKDDILVVLKNIDYSGSKRKKRLYFSLPKGDYDYQHFLKPTRIWKGKYWEQPFIMYFNAQDGQANDQSMTTPSTSKEKMLYNSWTIGNSTFKVWTYGDFKVYNTLPYIEVVGADDMVIIEETKKNLFGTKNCKVAITKAPFDGIFVQNFKDGTPNSWTHGIKKDDPIHLWTANEEWVFLAEGKDEWMAENLPHLFWRIKQLKEKESQVYSNEIGKSQVVIQQQKILKQRRFIKAPSETRDEAGGVINVQPTIELKDIPYKVIQPDNLDGRTRKVGYTKATKTKSGFSGYNAIGKKFGTVLKGNYGKRQIKDLNFNLNINTYDNLEFDLHFFKIIDNEIQHALTEEPVRIKLEQEKKWIKRDLSAYQIGVEGDILVIMEIVKSSPDNMGLFYALSPSHVLYKPKDKFYQGKKLDFWDNAFSLFLTIE